MKRQNKKIILSLWLLASLHWQAIPVRTQTGDAISAVIEEANIRDADQIYKNLLRKNRGAEYSILLEKIFGSEAETITNVFDEDSERLFQAVISGANGKAAEHFPKQTEARKRKARAEKTAAPDEKKTAPKTKPVRKNRPKSTKVGFTAQPKFDWRQFAFGFQPLPQLPQSSQDETPEIKFTQTDNEISASGETSKNFETAEAKGKRTQKAETRHINDGTNIGIEIKNTTIIEAVSKTNGETFRTETVMMWDALVAACPDADGVTRGTGKVKVGTKTVFSRGGQASTISTYSESKAKLNGFVNDQAELTHYDMQVDAYVTSSGQEDAFRRNLTKEIKLKDGTYGIRYDVSGSTIEISDGKYGGERTPARTGEMTGRKLTAMSDEDARVVNSSLSSLLPAISYSAGESYETAQKNWKDGSCVEVVCQAPKTELKTGESVDVSAETVHLQDKSKVNARLDAEAIAGTVAPDSQNATPGATFTFTKEGDGNSYLTVESVSKRGIGRSDIIFEKELEEPAENGAWTGTIEVRRHHLLEREKTSGANLAENGGYFQTNTYLTLTLTGRLDRTVEATNANIAIISGDQKHIDHEYDRYKVDEGFCGTNGPRYKGPKEVTKTSTTTTIYNKETRVYADIGNAEGTIAFSLPDTNGTAVYSYAQSSPCAIHDRVNTHETTLDDVVGVGGSFSFSFPVDSSQKTIRGSISVVEEDGGKTEYTWTLRRK